MNAISCIVSVHFLNYTFEWNNGATTQDLFNIPAGSYEVTVTGSLGGTKTLGPLEVEQPSAPLHTEVVNLVHEGCTFGGSIEAARNQEPSYRHVSNWISYCYGFH